MAAGPGKGKDGSPDRLSGNAPPVLLTKVSIQSRKRCRAGLWMPGRARHDGEEMHP